jgi:hypothetical protein
MPRPRISLEEPVDEGLDVLPDGDALLPGAVDDLVIDVREVHDEG